MMKTGLQRASRSACSIEALEGRRLLAFTATLGEGEALFAGDEAGDDLVIWESGGFLEHNRFASGDAGFVSARDFDSAVAGEQTAPSDGTVSLRVEAGAGDDTIWLKSPGAAAAQVDGQAGADQVRVYAAAAGSLVSVADTGPETSGDVLSVLGGDGTDHVAVDGQQVRWENRVLVHLAGGVDSLFIGTGRGNDTIRISGNTVPVTVSGGHGEDGIVVEHNIAAPVFVNGSCHRDLLIIEGTDAGDTLGIKGSTIELGGGQLEFDRCESVHLKGLDGDDTFHVSANNRLVAAYGGDGDDLLEVDDDCQRGVRFLGGAGQNKLIVNGSEGNDSLGLHVERGSQLSYRIMRSGYRSVAFYDTQAIVINGLGGHDHLWAGRTTIRVSLNGGDGDDSLFGPTRVPVAYDDDGFVSEYHLAGCYIDGGAGNDVIFLRSRRAYRLGEASWDVNTVLGGAGDDSIEGEVFGKDLVDLGPDQ